MRVEEVKETDKATKPSETSSPVPPKDTAEAYEAWRKAQREGYLECQLVEYGWPLDKDGHPIKE